MALVDLDATLAGTASTTAALELDVVLSSTLAGTAGLAGALAWKPSGKALPPKPSVNSGAELAQFIASVGPSKASQRTPVASSTVVNPNPPRKPFTPR